MITYVTGFAVFMLLITAIALRPARAESKTASGPSADEHVPTDGSTRMPAEKEVDEQKNLDLVLLDETNSHFNQFLTGQELFAKTILGAPEQLTPNRQLRYLHFVFGAADRLSREIPDCEAQEVWHFSCCYAHARAMQGDARAMEVVETYGQSGDHALDNAAELGWHTMSADLAYGRSNLSRDDYSRSCTALFAAISGNER